MKGETANDEAGEMQEKYPFMEGDLAIERVAAIKQGNWVALAVANDVSGSDGQKAAVKNFIS